MKLLALSDLHLEFEDFEPPATDTDVVTLAGDTHNGLDGIRWAIRSFSPTPVLYVMGNHEFYGETYQKVMERARTLAKGTNVRVLENETAVINGVTFFGCTLWTDFRMHNTPELDTHVCREKMTDFRRIRTLPHYSKLTPADTIRMHSDSKKALTSAQAKGTLDVVITHHAPSLRSVAEEHKDDPVSAAYASDLDYLVQSSNARFWIHGHIHESRDYVIGQTRVICNPRGYPDEPNHDFQGDLVLSV